jgi:hypothetical protein
VSEENAYEAGLIKLKAERDRYRAALEQVKERRVGDTMPYDIATDALTEPEGERWVKYAHWYQALCMGPGPGTGGQVTERRLTDEELDLLRESSDTVDRAAAATIDALTAELGDEQNMRAELKRHYANVAGALLALTEPEIERETS